MKAGTLLLILADIIEALKTAGYITPTGDFDDTKVNDLSSDLALVGVIETILKARNVAIPSKIDQVLQVIPLLAGLFK